MNIFNKRGDTEMAKTEANSKLDEAYDLIKNRKEAEKVADIYFTAQLENKKKEVDELKKEIAFLEDKRNNLAETIRKENKELLATIDQRKKDAEDKYNKSQSLLEDCTREKNFVEQEKSNIQGIRKDLENRIGEYNEMKGRIIRFVDTIK